MSFSTVPCNEDGDFLLAGGEGGIRRCRRCRRRQRPETAHRLPATRASTASRLHRVLDHPIRSFQRRVRGHVAADPGFGIGQYVILVLTAIATMRVRATAAESRGSRAGSRRGGSIAMTCGCVSSTTGSASFTVGALAATAKGGTASRWRAPRGRGGPER